MKRITSYIRKAVEDYQMIEEGDRVAVGISGGKDSLALLGGMALLSRYYPKKFTVIGLTLDMGAKADYSGIRRYCESFGVEYHVKETNIREIIFDIRKEPNPCALCAKMRRGALNDFAKEMGCKKVALGHHNDDVIETFFLSLLYEGRVNCFSPVTHLDRSGIYQIRPMIYVPEREVRGVARRLELPVMKSSCPVDGETKRQYIKELIHRLDEETTPGLKKRLFTAIQNGKLDGWKKEDSRKGM
ncbi:MAG: tRNA 2-thiocytidine(32) synthetase TtcA [Ruminococcaceae bacterium]|nr:tRNA 2-thiocytidine(32) synthetase TtcA [Oscillospiraceae bacterium]